MPKLVNNSRPSSEPSDAAIQRGVQAVADVLATRCDMDEALDVARNAAGPVLNLVEDETVHGIIAEVLRGRRRNWPNGQWSKLSAKEIRSLAFDAACAWERAMSVAPNRRASPLTRTRVSFDRHFDEVANRFSDFGAIELHVDEEAGTDNGRGAEREFGYCDEGPPIRIAFASKIEKLPEKNIDGLVAHEFGHALDFRYGKRDLEKMLKRRLPEGVERRADAIAEAVFGKTIKYDGKDVQCVSCSGKAPRPRRLG